MMNLDKSRSYAEIYGVAGHRFEQDGLRFNAQGECIDTIPEDFKPTQEHVEEVVEDEPRSTVIGNVNPNPLECPDPNCDYVGKTVKGTQMHHRRMHS